MATARYGRDRLRPRRRGVPGNKRISPWYILAGGFFVLYLIFLVRWQFGNVSNLEGSAPTQQLSNLRKASNPVHVQSDDAIDVEIAARQEEQRKNEERARQIPIKVVLPTTAPPTEAPVATEAPPVATIAAIPVPEKPRDLEKVAADEELEGRVPGMPEQIVEATTVQSTEAPAQEPVNAPEIETKAVPQPMMPAATVVPFESRHQTISGYAETMKFLENYQYNPNESLFLFFICSDDQFKADDWSEECVKGRQHVYDVFSKSPGRNRLVTVLAGSEKYWKHQNDFYNDPDLRVKGVPCVMQWEGRSGRTSGMLVQRSLYDEPFLRYLFKNTDQPKLLFAAEDVKNKQIITVNGYDAYVDAMIKYEKEENPVPTFLMMVSGRFRNNNRPWCPYCRYSELPLEYAFYTYAPKNARMIRVEVTDSYSEWRARTEFTNDENLQLKIVPLMFKIKQLPPKAPNGPRSIQFTQHKVRYDELASVRELFSKFP
ncbi:hypothetical protein PHMEG_00018874 [Phytophthora megakarya]|uniref:Thioredoxin domain-containing protein n=1 Tax=Phytophthora megakarya TaxID=4795 RepID=A0A225VSY1_9STRA|nr:hypothetical protein PHMEG_00018874 [Phytophthora megakarya]